MYTFKLYAMHLLLLFTLLDPYNFFKYIREFDDFLNTNVNIPRIIMTYEDLSHHPTDNVKRLARFLGLDCSDEKIAEVVKSCSFDNMKKADAEFKEEFKGKRTKDGESAVFRKGQIYKTKQKIHVLPEKTLSLS